MNIIQQLEQRIAENCTAIDREEQFDAMLDECYTFESVGGPFACMSPSRVLKEIDPIAYRCGVNDFADGQDWREIGSSYYMADDCEEQREELLYELDSALREAEESESHDEVAAIEADIAAVKAHVFEA